MTMLWHLNCLVRLFMRMVDLGKHPLMSFIQIFMPMPVTVYMNAMLMDEVSKEIRIRRKSILKKH